MPRASLIVRTLPALVGALFAGTASAAGFQLLEQNGSGLGNAYAGSAAVADNASTIFFNPAGMTRLQPREFSVGVAAIRPSYKFNNQGSSVAPAPTGSEGGDAGDWGFVPNAYLSWALSRDLYAGIGINAPFGLKTEYDSDWVGRFQSTKFDIKTINVNPSLAYRVNERVSVGVGVSWQRFEATYERMASAGSPLLPVLDPRNVAAQGTRIKLDADDDTWGWNVGAMFQVTPTTRLGVSYRSKIEHKLEGTLKSTNQAVFRNADARAKIELPDTFVLSAVQQVGDRWEFLGDISWTGWSSIKNVDIFASTVTGRPAQTLDVDFQDSWRVAFGATYKYNEAWKAKVGLAWDQTPVKRASTRLTSLPDEDRVWLSLGGQWKPSNTSALDLGLAYLILKDPKINNDQRTSGRGLVSGEYDANAWIVALQYSQSF